jgi:soluble lytic murein transglycosylase-like protein
MKKQIPFKTLYEIAAKFENKHATEETINKFYILAVIYTESEAVNYVGEGRYAQGLMQISDIARQEVNRIYGRNFTYEDLHNIESNIECGVLLLKYYYNYWYERVHNVSQAINLMFLSYSWGITNTINWISKTFPSNNYIDEKIPEEKKYYNESIMFWYYRVLTKYEQEILKNN